MFGRYSNRCIHGGEAGKCDQCFELWKNGTPGEDLIDYEYMKRVKEEDRLLYLEKLGVSKKGA